MDGNNYNNNNQNGSSDSFYSYNNGSQSNQQTEHANEGNVNQYNNSYQNTNSYSQNAGYQQGSAYQNGTYQNTGYQQNGAYQNGGYQNTNGAFYQNAQTTGKKQKKKRERKPGGFGTKLAKCAAIALVFGLVSGTAFEGVHLVSSKAFGNDETAVSDSGSQNALTKADNKVEATSTSSNYVATDVSDIVSSVMPSIVAITNVSETEYQSFWGGMPQTYESTSCGSGIIVSQDDNYLYVATNNHVVNGANSLTVTFNDESTVSAEVKGTVPSTDLAVIRVALSSIESDTMNNIKVATLGDSDSLKVGNSCIAIGNALGYGQSVTVGYISALNRQVSVSDSESDTSYTADLIQTDAAINPGNSGGALLNMEGEVVGINSAKLASTEVEGMGYAIAISDVTDILQNLMNETSRDKLDDSEHGVLGIEGSSVSSEAVQMYGIPAGVFVKKVTEGGAADKAGLKANSVITEFNGKTVSSIDQLIEYLSYYEPDEEVELTVQVPHGTSYKEETVKVTLDENTDADDSDDNDKDSKKSKKDSKKSSKDADEDVDEDTDSEDSMDSDDTEESENPFIQYFENQGFFR